MTAPRYVDRNFNCIPNCGSKDGCNDGVCKAKQIIDAPAAPLDGWVSAFESWVSHELGAPTSFSIDDMRECWNAARKVGK